eukprot:m.151145 g.151145  ORF g.151145 m.151145 type:complete len:77 (+) comp14243_c0_seq13:246-476(+)
MSNMVPGRYLKGSKVEAVRVSEWKDAVSCLCTGLLSHTISQVALFRLTYHTSRRRTEPRSDLSNAFQFRSQRQEAP